MQKILAIGLIFASSLFLMPILSSGQQPGIEIKANMKAGDYVDTNLWFQTTNITFGQGNKICPNNDCEYELQDGTFNDFGGSRYINGKLKLEDKSSSENNFTSFNYYDLTGSFELQNSKESPSEKLFFYGGDLTMEKKGEVPEKFEYASKIILSEPSNTFVLTGTPK